MTKKAEPLSKFLLPIAKKGVFKAACRLAGAMAEILGERVSEITLLHVMAGRYLSTHMANIDIRAEILIESETFRKLREEFINKEIVPVLNEAKKTIEQFHPKAPINMEIVDGKPASKILEFVNEYGYSTIFMQRRCIDPVKGSFIGSVTSGILYGNGACSVYVPGTDFPESGPVPLNSFLVAVDGSPGSMAAVKEVGVLMGYAKESKVILLSVVDVVDLAEAAKSDSWPTPVQEAEVTLMAAQETLEDMGIKSDRITQKILAGDPAEKIAALSDESEADIIFLGRTVRSAITDVLVGSVARAVLGRCAKKTIAVVSPREEE